ncbi:hypothetical protein BJ912DRAFT_1130722 [Pholiota molesta]|nr:hypothetical protein BJ912DRAFT_1130722 [Pholiota molesta]
MPNPSNSLLSSPPSSISTSPVKEPVYISPMKKVPLKQSQSNSGIPHVYTRPTSLPTPDLPTTPTKRPRSDETPRASLRYQSYSDATPRRIPAGLRPRTLQQPHTRPEPTPARALTAIRSGFTLAYLRRVPELSLLASRVVDARPAPAAPRPPPAVRGAEARAGEGVVPVGRDQAPARGVPRHLGRARAPVLGHPITSVSRLWKSNASASTAGGNSTLFSSTLGSLPSFLTEENDDETKERSRILIQRGGEEILDVLRNDDRWQYVGTWMVDDALKSLEAESRVWQMGRGKWDLTV